MAKKRIAFVANTSWYIYNLRMGVIRALQAEGYEIVSIAPVDSYTVNLTDEGIEHHHFKIDNKGRNLHRDFSSLLHLAKLYRRLRLDFIFHYTIKPNIYGSIAARRHGVPSISVVSGAGYTFAKKNLLYGLTIFLYRIASVFALETWFVNTDDLEEFLEKKIVKTDKIRLLPGEGVDTSHFSPRPKRTDDDNKLIFLLSARLIWDKGIGEYVAAAQRIRQQFPNAIFQLLGFLDVENPSAISSQQIHDWHKEGNIQYLGETRDVRPYLEKIDCFVLPSFYREGTPRSLLEAAAMAIPIITTDNVGCREVVRDGYNGLLCNTQSVDDLVDKMKVIIQLTVEERTQMGKNGRKFILENFGEKGVIQHYLEVLKEVV